jgi:hypothetical protein
MYTYTLLYSNRSITLHTSAFYTEVSFFFLNYAKQIIVFVVDDKNEQSKLRLLFINNIIVVLTTGTLFSRN